MRVLRRIADLLHDPAIPCGALVAVFVGAIVVQASQRLNWDVGWLLIATRRLLAGRRLYVEDFVDPNPPLILYLLVPPVTAARALAVSEIAALRAYVFAPLRGRSRSARGWPRSGFPGASARRRAGGSSSLPSACSCSIDGSSPSASS